MDTEFQVAWLWIGEQLLGHGVPMAVAVAVTLGLVMLGWLTFGPRYKQRIAALEKKVNTKGADDAVDLAGVIKSRGNVTVVEGDQHNHYTLPAGAEITVPKLIHFEVIEHVSVHDDSHSVLTKADGTIEVQSSWDPGRGDLAAAAIEAAPTFEVATKIFNDWRWSPQPRVPEQAFPAMEDRLRSEGEGEETVRFLREHGAWEGSTEWLPDVPTNDPHRFEWALMLFSRQREGEDAR